ncbi:hypothetical protein L0668_08360 [Paraglaciecola aquimarina]|uniref:Phosphoenolpyruvate synthase n=1 Tax=Paraglaciecola algarum TaxID=3050085 RepID=A0ABS9D5Q7_9ALTE|nr:PEP/pyruvate-binding domain-containing protein [Paraglaciecola sp. G1-23]MCF2948115.1 hypothetical protein [Paraglaciecola sp. G1-23]
MKTLNFSSKALNLANLETQLRSAKIMPQLPITAIEWESAEQKLANLTRLPHWINDTVIVRSSAENEDGIDNSMAGKYLSIADVKSHFEIEQAISKVFNSFDQFHPHNGVFVQPMLSDVAMSGVAFSRDPNSAGHYYIINYDEESGRLDTVTDGSSNNLKTYYQSKDKNLTSHPTFRSIIKLIDELEQTFNYDSIDIEFAITRENELILLQVRPLVKNSTNNISLQKQSEVLSNIESTVARLSNSHPYLLGKKGIFGIMPDWNPAEMIGVRPRPLSFSLYRELITDNIWAYQRHNYGYRNLRSFPLLVNLNGSPYVDVRVSFNSFIPADLDEPLAEKLVEVYLGKLRDNPNYHDKVEFEIIHSCYTPDISERLAYLKEYDFSDADIASIKASLKTITDKIIYSKSALWIKDLAKIEKLKHRQAAINNSELSDIEKIYWLLEDCKRYGTLPFAGLARAGFIAIQILKSFVGMNLIDAKEYDLILSTKETVSSEMSKDYKVLGKSQFLKKYGHLRPGAYDILTKRYDEAPEQYFNDIKEDVLEMTHSTLAQNVFSIEQRLKQDLNKIGYSENIDELFDFLWGAIKGREYGKFVFTKSLSDILSLLSNWGESLGISKDDMSYADIQVVKQFYSCSEENTPVLKRSIENGRTTFKDLCCLQLPALITSSNQVKQFTRPKSEPNYITLGSTSGSVIDIEQDKSKFQGNILMIPNADPGFDWIFLHKISGFITMYGGANSHMAIRACELGIPAIVGAGEALYNTWSNAKRLNIDCANKTVTALK